MERKNITNATKLILIIWNVGLFSLIYEKYYVFFAFRSHVKEGGLASLILYVFLYLWFCNLYKAFRIASSYVGDIIFSQTIAFGLSDLILYAECCMINRNYVSVWPGALFVVAQFLGTVLIITISKKQIIKRVSPKPTLLLYGDDIPLEDVEAFRHRILMKYSHLFDIGICKSEADESIEIEEAFKQSGVILLFELSAQHRQEYIRRCLNDGKIFYFTPEIEDIVCQGCSPKHLLDTPLMKYDYAYQNLSKRFWKRFCDILFSMVLIVLFSPFMALTALGVKLQDGGPVLFKQKRYTQNMREFTIYKFRSMIVDAEKNGAQPCSVGDSRITTFGRLIRAIRFDELPQLFNILKGDMSFVGPRPERVEHVEKYTAQLPEFRYRLAVKGGLTGYAQIYGKYNTSAYDKLRLDLMYIENQSFLLDLKLCLLTFKILFEKESTEGFANIQDKFIL